MPDTIQCATHGESARAYVCIHLVGETFALGFNRDTPTAAKPYPDAWCDNCELVRAAHGGWNEASENLTKISLLCSGCYERACIRNMIPPVTLADLAGFRWKCGTCDEWHKGPLLDLGYNSPYYWREDYAAAGIQSEISPSTHRVWPESFLTEDYCVVHNEHFFVRGLINLPVVGTNQSFRWGVWGSLSRQNFELQWMKEKNLDRLKLPAMFSWLSTQISDYPETLSLKMYLRTQEVGVRPNFELELTDHPISQEYHKGITPERVRSIMMNALAETQ
jgi:hypothetical protein